MPLGRGAGRGHRGPRVPLGTGALRCCVHHVGWGLLRLFLASAPPGPDALLWRPSPVVAGHGPGDQWATVCPCLGPGPRASWIPQLASCAFSRQTTLAPRREVRGPSSARGIRREAGPGQEGPACTSLSQREPWGPDGGGPPAGLAAGLRSGMAGETAAPPPGAGRPPVTPEVQECGTAQG